MFEPTPAARRPLVVSAHPGGRYPGVELPATWYTGSETAIPIPSALPAKGDLDAVFGGVTAMSTAIRDAALQAYRQNEHPMLIGGDHSLAVGSLSAAATHHERVGVVWVDAHPDYNTLETSPSGNPHGMPLAAATGIGDARLLALFGGRHVAPSDVVLIAARDIDAGERALLDQQGVWCVSVAELRAMGIPALTEAIARRLGGIPVHLSYDFDSIDERFFKATGTPVADGLTPDEGEALVRGLAARLPIVSSDWVEFDPRHPEAEASAAIARRIHGAFCQAMDARGDQTASCA